MSGSHKQASRRSAVDEDWERPTTFGGSNGIPRFEMPPTDPSDDDLLKELAKKRTLNCSLQEKKDRLVTPIVDQRDDILKTVKKKLPGPNPTTNSPIYDALDRAIPKSFAKTANGEKMAKAVLGMYSALNACIEVLEEDGARVPRLLSRHFEELKIAIDSATANFQADALSKYSSVFVALTTQQKERCYKQNGFLPTDEAHRICVGCKHQFVDEPDTNKTVAEKNKVNRRAFEEKKKQAEEEAKQNKTKPKRMLAPKAEQQYRQCHCSQMRCLSPDNDVGSSCPIRCINPETNQKYGKDSSGVCACPICKCTCNIAVTYNASHTLDTIQLLKDCGIERKEELEAEKGRSHLSFLVDEACSTSMRATANSGIPEKQRQNMATTAAAKSLTRNFNPTHHRAFVKEMREKIGKPTTTVTLPAPILIGGKLTSVADTRTISTNFSGHRQRNNRLSEGAASAQLPLHPYLDAYALMDAAKTSGILGGQNSQEEEVEEQDSDSDFLQAIQNSLRDERSVTRSPQLTPPPSSSNVVVLLDSTPRFGRVAQPPPAANSAEKFKTRVKRRAFLRSQETAEVFDSEKAGSPELHAKSPYSLKVFQALSGSGNATVTEYTDMYHETNPEADSQEAYEHVSNMMRTLDGKKQKRYH